MKAINVEELSKTFSGGTVAVDGIRFSLNQGEIFGFLGPNGAGKTTTVKLLCGMLTPSGGKCQVLGIDPTQNVEVRDGDLISLEDNLNVQVISTPGHSADEVSYRIGNRLFLGDTIPVKGDIPIYINVCDELSTLQKIRDLNGICNYYPAWDQTYSVLDINEKINDAEHIIRTLDEQVQMILEAEKTTDITVIMNLICERLKMPYLKENPLFRKTVLAHCRNHGWKY